jgi:outer membrane protein TolC
MTLSTQHLWRFPVRLAGGFTLACGLAGFSIAADEPPAAPPAPPAATAPAASPGSTLSELIALALENQPNVKAARASLASAETQLAGVESLRFTAGLVQHDLDIRKKQACLGVTIAQAGLQRAEQETVYAVSRTYLTVQYARAQKKVASEVSDNLKFYQERVAEIVKKGESRDLTTNSVDKITVYLRLAENKRAEAEHGIDRAVAALREAVGLCGNVPLTIADVPLPQPTGNPKKEEIIQLAIMHRPELIQVVTAAEVFHLEPAAQARFPLPGQVPTLAAGGDIHSQPVPPTVIDGEYRPGGLLPEMPVSLGGPRWARVQRACDLATRADAVAEKTHNLIVLEAEDTFLKWNEARAKVAQSKDGVEAGNRLATNTRADFRGEQKVKLDEVLTNEVLAGQAQGALNEALFQQALGFVNLERVTGGGFCAGLTAPSPK